MTRLFTSLAAFAAAALLAQTVQVPSPKQGRPGDVLPWTRFRPRTESYVPTADEQRQIRDKMASLAAMLRDLETRRVDPALLVDVALFHEAACWQMEFPEEFFRKESVPAALQVLEQGIERAAQLKEGRSPWTTQKGRLIRGYRSAVDGSIQPLRLTIPDEYDGSRALPLDVIEHGRYVTRYEIEFINAFPRRGPDRPHLPGTIQVELFGRGNNAFHWPGEADVFEGISAVRKMYKTDPERTALRGFSMGGAGVWHTALHHPDLWASVEAGAGDTQSHRYPVLAELAPHQQAMATIFDNTFEWMLNAYNMPFIAYVGEIDGSFRKHVLARQQLTREGFKFEGESFTGGLRLVENPSLMFFVAPNTPHSTHPEFRKRMDAIHLANLQRGRVSPDHIRFLTYTTRYNRSYWVTLDGLEKHYERAEVNAKRSQDRTQYEISTKNLARLALRETDRAASLTIDGQKVSFKPAAALTFEKSNGRWAQADADPPGLRKKHGLQGPIDDAFLEPFLVVRPTGAPWNPAAHRQALRILDRIDRQYRLAYRGRLRVKDDRDVTADDFKNYHVVLFGDPGSNPWIAKAAASLPVSWTKQAVTVGDRKFASAEVLPALIYPNPLNPAKYVVLNSGLTAEWEDWAGDFPMPQYGDFAILRVNEAREIPEVAHAGLFNEHWR
jgi:pimeloyl-ACP methyl ester carboxylesterase